MMRFCRNILAPALVLACWGPAVLAAPVPAAGSGQVERTLPELAGIRLCASSPQDLAALESLSRRCLEEMAWQFGWAGLPEKLQLVVCYDVPAPANAPKALLLGSNLSFEENAQAMFRELLLQLYVDRRRLAFAPTRIADLDWLVSGLVYGVEHRIRTDTPVSPLPDLRPLLGLYYAPGRPFSFGDWVARPIPASPSLAYDFYGLNSFFLMRFFSISTPLALEGWLQAWSEGAAPAEAARLLLARQVRPEEFDSAFSEAVALWLGENRPVAPAEFRGELDRRLACLRNAKGEWRPWNECRSAAAQAEIAKAQESLVSLWKRSPALFQPAAKGYVDACRLALEPTSWYQADFMAAWSYGRQLDAAGEELAAAEERMRQVGKLLDRCQAEQRPASEMAPTLLLIRGHQEYLRLRADPKLNLWLDEWDRKRR